MRHLLPILLFLAPLIPALAAGGEAVGESRPGDWFLYDTYSIYAESEDGKREAELSIRLVMAGVKDHAYLVVTTQEPTPKPYAIDPLREVDPMTEKWVCPKEDDPPGFLTQMLTDPALGRTEIRKIDAVPETLETPAGVFSCLKTTYAYNLVAPSGEDFLAGRAIVWMCAELPSPGFARLEIEESEADEDGNVEAGDRTFCVLRETGRGPPPDPEMLEALEFIDENMRWD